MSIKSSDIENVPESVPKKPKIFHELLTTITVTLSVMSCGFHYSWPSPTIPKLLSEDSYIPINPSEGSWLAVASMILGLFSAPFAASFVDRYGRKISTMITIPLYLISWFCIGFTKVYTVLLLGRCIAGVADGFTYTAVLTYVGEIASSRIRGFLGSLITVVLLSAGLFVNSVAPFVSIQTMSLIFAVVPLIQLFLCIFLPESPYYLLMKEDQKSATKSLQYLRGTTNVSQELNEIKNAVKRQMSERGDYKDLVMQQGNRKALLICIGLRTSQQLSGITAVMFYTQHIFKENNELISATTGVIIFNCLQMITASFSSLIMDKLGRKILYTLSSGGCGITLGVTAIYLYIKQNEIDVSNYLWVPMVSLCSFIITYNFGMSIVPVTMISELFPTNVKTKALAVMEMYFSFIVSVITKLFQYLDSEYGMYVPFIFFSLCCVLGIVFGLFFLPETKNKTLEEIQMMLRNTKIVESNLSETKQNKSNQDVSTHI